MLTMFRKMTAGFAAATLAAGMFATPAKAVVSITPGQTITGIAADANSEPAGAVLVAGPLVVNGTTTTGGTYTMTQEVYKETGGTYDFLYQVKNTGTNTITSFAPTNYAGFLTLVGYETIVPSGFATGTVGTSTIGRSVDGSTISYIFTGGLAAGATSMVFVAQTNANFFNQLGTAQLADTTAGGANGGATINNIYQPFTAPPPGVPEPASMTLLGGFVAVAGLVAYRRRKTS